MSDGNRRAHSPEWHEQRHVQLARKCANYRKNIKSLQGSHDRYQALYFDISHSWRDRVDDWRKREAAYQKEISDLKTELARSLGWRRWFK